MRATRGLLAAGVSVFAVLWIGGVANYMIRGAPPPGLGWTAPVFLIVGALVCVAAVESRQAVTLTMAGLLGWGTEAIGVRTGIPFGSYAYTDALGPGALGVPFAMVPAWLMLVAYVVHLWRCVNIHPWLRLGCSALWLVLADLVLDPVAAGPLGFWRWTNSGPYYGVPLVNFAGWSVVGICTVLIAGRPERSSPWVLGIGAATIAFFAVLAVSLGMVVPALLGAALCAGHAMMMQQQRRCST